MTPSFLLHSSSSARDTTVSDELSPLRKGTIMNMIWYPYEIATGSSKNGGYDDDRPSRITAGTSRNNVKSSNTTLDPIVVQVLSITRKRNVVGTYYDDDNDSSNNYNNNNDDNNNNKRQHCLRTYHNKIVLEVSDSDLFIEAILLVEDVEEEEDDDEEECSSTTTTIQKKKKTTPTRTSKIKTTTTTTNNSIRRMKDIIKPHMFLQITKFRCVQRKGSKIKMAHSIIIEKYTILHTSIDTTTTIIGYPSDVNHTYHNDINIVTLAKLIRYTECDKDMDEIACNLSFHNKGSSIIADAIRYNNRHIHALYLGHCKMGDTGITILADAIRNHPTIRNLDLSDNNITERGFEVLTNIIENKQKKKKNSIRILVLNNNCIGDDGVIHLAHLLLANNNTNNTTNLKGLYLSDNSIRISGAIALADALRINTTIQTLCLNENHIGDEGVIALADAIRSNRTLQTLLLRENNIGDDGVIAIATALVDNNYYNNITKLDVSLNKISNVGIMFVADTLKYNNTKLQELQIYGNRFDTIGSLTMYKAMEYNTTLRILLLFDQLYDDDEIWLNNNNNDDDNIDDTDNNNNNNNAAADSDDDTNADDDDDDSDDNDTDGDDDDDNDINSEDDDDDDVTNLSDGIANQQLLFQQRNNDGNDNLLLLNDDNNDADADANGIRYQDYVLVAIPMDYDNNDNNNHNHTTYYNENDIWEMLRHNDTLMQILDVKLPRCLEKILCPYEPLPETVLWRKEYATKKNSRQRMDIYPWLLQNIEQWLPTSTSSSSSSSNNRRIMMMTKEDEDEEEQQHQQSAVIITELSSPSVQHQRKRIKTFSHEA